MTVKQKILKEIDNMPDKILQQAYSYLHALSKKIKKQTKSKKEVYWKQLTAEQFFEGYSDKDTLYDQL